MEKRAILYRMASPEHLCPFGLKTKDLLKRNGYAVEDRPLRSRDAADAFKEEHQVDTTPQTFIGGSRVGGYEDVRRYFALGPEKKEGTTYTPVVAIFLSSGLMAAVLVWSLQGTLFSALLLQWFVAFSMCVLAIQKLRDLTAFSNQFIVYDLLAMRVVRYAYVYPFAEFYVGIGMLASFPAWTVAPLALLIGAIGATSVFKAVYLDKRELKCACVGGKSNVPLGFVSLTENLLMIFAAFWMWLA